VGVREVGEAVNEEVDILARTLLGEARGEGDAGMAAVAAVVANRVGRGARYARKWGRPHPLYGDGTFKSACLAKKQFSCWNANDRNRDFIAGLDLAQYPGATGIAEATVAGTVTDTTGGATHYLTEAAFLASPDDHWCRKNPPLCQIGSHLFFKEP
jgi:spore germination cell wall hydrolase CwlJ-like protein